MADHTSESKEEIILKRITALFGLIRTSYDKFKKSISENEDYWRCLQTFVNDKDCIHLICLQTGAETGSMTNDMATPNMFKRKGVIAIKIGSEGLTPENINSDIVFIEMNRNVLEHLYGHFQEIYMPVFHNPQNQAGWSELVSKDLMEKFNSYLAQVYVTIGLIKGKTLLPLPPYKLATSDSTPDKDKAHIFEGSIITWTRQIKNVLKLEPEQALKAGQDPNPLTEINFWKKKSENLNSIYQQLQSDRVKKILKFLEQNKSTYTSPFSKLQKEVQAARMEANDNYRFLQTLEPLFEQLTEHGRDFRELHELFIPIMHTILLIWKHSKYYNTPPRLVVLIREICNAIIDKARDFISGAAIFNMIQENEAGQACENLQTTIDVCTKFKDAYYDYKAKANGTWKLTTNALFVRLDSFLERCHDILHLTNTIVQFNKLAKIEIGGTKGKTLTESVQTIYNEFLDSVDLFQHVVYDIMNIAAREFDDDFYIFRSKIKELERRLASVITQGFDDCDTIHGRFKLLDSFEGLLTRPIIQDELEKKHIVLIDSYKQDLKSVQTVFLEGKVLSDKRDERAPIYNNLPPIAGTLTWCRSLVDRIKEPMDKLSTLSQVIVDREEFKDVQKLYASIVKGIKDYEDSKILQWEREADESSKEKLKEFLLRRDDQDLLRVNFDPALVRLLREVRYFYLLDLTVPQGASDIFANDERYRQQINNLELIVSKYNNIKTCLHPVEEPLIIDNIKLMDAKLKPAIEEITWKSKNIESFVEDTKGIVEKIDAVVSKMKEQLDRIRNSLEKICLPEGKQYLERKPKPTSPDDFFQVHSALIGNKHSFVKQEGSNIQKALKEIFDSIKSENRGLDKKSIIWVNYTDYVNDIIIMGMAKAISIAVSNVNDQISFSYIRRHELQPIFDIKMVLENTGVAYEPEIAESETISMTVRNIINGWIRDFIHIGTLIARLDTGGTGDYMAEIKDSFEIREQMANVSENLDYIEEECNKYKEKFNDFRYLWKQDPEATFEEFMQVEIEKEMEVLIKRAQDQAEKKGNDPTMPFSQEEPKALTNDDTILDENLPLLKSAAAKIPKLELFDDKITKLETVKADISSQKAIHDIGWLRINAQPLKDRLNIKVQNWMKVYTGFLYKQIKIIMANIKEFNKATEEGIKKNPIDDQGNRELLMSVMKVTLQVVTIVEPNIDKVINRLKGMVGVLKKHGVQMDDDYLTSIDAVYSNFRTIYEKAFNVKREIMFLQLREQENLKLRLDQFGNQVQHFRNEFQKVLPYSYDENLPIEDINAAYGSIMEYYEKLVKIEVESKDYNELALLFELPQQQHKALKDCRNDLKNLKQMWDAVAMVNYQYNDWKGKTWKSIKTDVLDTSNKMLQSQVKNLPKEVKYFKGFNTLSDKITNMGKVLPLISSLHSEFMEKRHWEELKQITKQDFDPYSPSFNFADILRLELYKFETQVNEIVDKAQKEAKIEKKLRKIETDWNKQVFEFDELKDGTKLFRGMDEMMEMLDANQMDLLSMTSQGKYVEFFKKTVDEWRQKLRNVDQIVNVWLKVQKNWKRLVNIFLSSDDIRQTLQEETKRFEAVDKEFRDLMQEAFNAPGVIENCFPQRYELLENMRLTIEGCEKALNEYLEQKKKVFPRFYFVSDAALIDILSNGNNPQKVAEYLGDCFDGLKDLDFIVDPATGAQTNKAKGMKSREGEYVVFPEDKPFVAEGPVETWLSNLEFKMRQVLADTLEAAKFAADNWEVDKPREDWCKEYKPAQLVLVTTQIVWTEEVNRAFEDLEGGSEMAMKEYLNTIKARIDKLIDKVKREPLTGEERTKIITIITIDVHSRDVVKKFVDMKLQEKDSFNWQSQLKFYWEQLKDVNEMAAKQNLRFPWEKDKDKAKCIVRIVDWALFYSYEYVGNCGRLVITPLTDRCYITLTQALNLTMGGAPAGPAGTGKTETTKDLGRAIGLPVMVFNCSDQMNYQSMAQIFMGLSQSGAWGCFDEFNRISIEVLSVVSTQVKSVLDALKERKLKFMFMEEEIGLVDSVGFFITMNPGYAGRTELPENLKALFRSCAMVVPDIVLISENMLMSEGFQTAEILAKKFVTLYDLSKALLSKQKHYDWGLRAVKSVLRQAGKLRRADPDLEEDPLLKKALRDFNLPKIVTDDREIFKNLIEDLFPKIQFTEKIDIELKKDVIQAAKGLGYNTTEEGFALKCVQLSEILEVRHCCFVIGPPGSGKSAVWQTLAEAYKGRGQDTQFDTLNPKAVTADELFGALSKSKEWKDGVLSTIMRNQSKNLDKYKPSHIWKWVILDGDIDPEWIESLNTVMDDNKILTLVSNERIPLSASMRLLLEISNLRNATPATVSRGGVLFINDNDVGVRPYYESWMDRSRFKAKGSEYDDPNAPPKIDDVAKSVFLTLFPKFFGENTELSKMKRITPVVDMASVQATCAIIDALLQDYLPLIDKTKEDEQKKLIYEGFFIFAGMWGIGGAFEGASDNNNEFKAFTQIWKMQNANAKAKIPEQGSPFDYYFDPEEYRWVEWKRKVVEYEPPAEGEDVNFSKIYIPTVQTVRLNYLMEQHVKRRKPVMFVGSAGTGKTAVIKDFLRTCTPDKTVHATVNFNSFTDSFNLQKSIESKVEKKSGRVFGLPSNKVLVFFIDDLNMPYVDKYGTQTPIALMRQVIDYGLLFDRDHLEEQKTIQDLLFVSCMNPKAGSFFVDVRLQRHFSIFSFGTPTTDILKSIYGQILAGHLVTNVDKNWYNFAYKIIDATIKVFEKIVGEASFSPSAKKFHYQFNLRELSKIVEGLMLSRAQGYRSDPSKFIRLWMHEYKRVVEDRLNNEADIEKFQLFIREAGKILADEDKDGVIEKEFKEAGPDGKVPNIFTAFVSDEHHYLPIASMAALKKSLEEKLSDYNEVKAVMNLVLFDQAMDHICRIARILDTPGGNALLIGVGGSGKQSLSKLAAFIVGVEIDQIVVTSSYSMNDLKAFLQELVKKCIKSSGGGPRAFMLTDSQITKESFLVYINDMLAQGYIPDLFPKEEEEGIIQGLRNEAKGFGYGDSAEALRGYFLDKLRKNLHVILCFSPVGDTMRIRARKFPGIISATQVDWFFGWPRDALVDVAFRFISDVQLPSEDLHASIANNMAAVHVSINEANNKFLARERRYNYTTPKSFLELIDFYKKLLTEKRDDIERQITRLENGLEALVQTTAQVEGLQADLEVRMVEVEKKEKATAILIEEVTKKNEKAQAEEQLASIQETNANEKNQSAEVSKATAMEALAEAIPALEKAEAAVKVLEKKHIDEMKSFNTPGVGIILTAKAVMILMSNEKMPANEDPMKTWKRGQQFLSNPSKFIKDIGEFDGKNIDEKRLEAVKAIIDNPQNNFTETELSSKNFAAGKLGAFVINIATFNRIYKQVKPLQDAKDQAEKEAEGAKKNLAEAREKVRKATEVKDEAQKQLDGAILEKMAVQADAQRCKDKLDAAFRLVDGLAGENKRWGLNVLQLKEMRSTVIGDAFLAASFVSYIGPFSAAFRLELWKEKWMAFIRDGKIPITEGIEPLKILTNESEMAIWKTENLPSDQMSLENAAIISKCSRWPLMIDPQLQGSTWIRGHVKEGLITFSLTQDKWIRKLVDAIQMGRTVMIENLGQDLDATLEPLLSRAIIKKGNTAIIELGGDPIDYDMNFRLYLQTKLPNPHYKPEVAAQCTIINFIVTENGLEDQLLAMVVKVERPELEEKKSELVRKLNNFQVELAKLEEDLLNNLSSADPATILDNKELTDSLDRTKLTSIDISQQQEQAKITEKEINIQRENYRIVAAEGSMLYFLIISLNFIDHMYQYSLEAFTNFFAKAIERTTTHDEGRIEDLRKNIRYTIYQWVSRGLFEKHKLILLSMITFRLMQKKVIDVAYDSAQLHFLLTCIPKPGVDCSLDWLPVPAWNAIQRLCDLEDFRSFAQNLEKDAPSRFKDWYNDLEPENQKLPLDWKKLEGTFQKLLVIRCLRPDRITTALLQFIRGVLPDGPGYVEMDQKLSFNEILSSSLEDSNPNTPIFFILSPGADPVKEVEKIGKKKGFEPGKNLWVIALGQGVEQTAMAKLELANREGHWVMLQNIHLMPNWLVELEKKLDAFQLEGGGNNPAFRLFLSAEPSTAVPIGVLNRSIKLTNEPPAGLRANMKRAWTYFPKEEIEDKDSKMKSILFALCFFHATVIERRKFGPKGWNMFYPFSIGDLRDSYAVLNKYFEGISGNKIPFDDLTYIFGEIMYGGHIVDDWDRRLCRAYLENSMTKGLFEEAELYPYAEGKGISFKSPAPNTYEKFYEYIELTLSTESPLAYGLHPNTEIGFRTTQCNVLFDTLVELQPPDAAATSTSSEESSGLRSKNDIASDIIKTVLEELNLKNEIFILEDIKTKIEKKEDPFANVFLQECEYMNILLIEIIRSLEELSLGFQGTLTISEQMEQLIDFVALDKVPKTWVDLAYPSKRGLGSWLQNLLKRIEQLRNWKDEPNIIPKVTMLNRLFNPQSFLTAIKQVVGRDKSWELNRIIIQTDVTKKSIEEIDTRPKEGAYIFGLVLEGARWDIGSGQLEESRPKEMFSVVPVTLCRAVLQQQEKEERGYYYCPTYKTEDRGNTYVFTAQLKTKFNPRKWILAGVALLLDVEGVEEATKKKDKKSKK